MPARFSVTETCRCDMYMDQMAFMYRKMCLSVGYRCSVYSVSQCADINIVASAYKKSDDLHRQPLLASIGISLFLRSKDCFQDNGCKDKDFSGE